MLGAVILHAETLAETLRAVIDSTGSDDERFGAERAVWAVARVCTCYNDPFDEEGFLRECGL